MAAVLRIPRELYNATQAHLRSEAPNEGVGLWLGKLGKVARVVPLPNTHPRPQVAYTAEPIALLQAIRSHEEQGFDLLAIYHSHPKGLASPSPADRQKAYWRVPYVIFALEPAEARAYKLPEGEEVNIVVEGRGSRTIGKGLREEG